MVSALPQARLDTVWYAETTPAISGITLTHISESVIPSLTRAIPTGRKRVTNAPTISMATISRSDSPPRRCGSRSRRCWNRRLPGRLSSDPHCNVEYPWLRGDPSSATGGCFAVGRGGAYPILRRGWGVFCGVLDGIRNPPRESNATRLHGKPHEH